MLIINKSTVYYMTPDGTEFLVPNKLTFEQERELIDNYENPEYVVDVLKVSAKTQDFFTPDELISMASKSDLLDYKNGQLIIPSVSKVGVPAYIANKLIKSEDKQTILNFWTLLSMNPDPVCRRNLLKFLERNQIEILPSGLFVGYRNVVKVQNEKLSEKLEQFRKQCEAMDVPLDSVYLDCKDGEFSLVRNATLLGTLEDNLKDMAVLPEFTDNYSRTMKINIGVPVRMPREECDSDSENECSSGLHISFKNWGGLGGFGNQTLTCVVDPSKVVAVPNSSEYCKLRVCEYLPVGIGVLDADELNDELIKSYTDIVYLDVSRETDSNFKIRTGNNPEPEHIRKMKQEIARRFIKHS